MHALRVLFTAWEAQGKAPALTQLVLRRAPAFPLGAMQEASKAPANQSLSLLVLELRSFDLNGTRKHLLLTEPSTASVDGCGSLFKPCSASAALLGVFSPGDFAGKCFSDSHSPSY